MKTFAPAGAAHVPAQARRRRLSRDLFTASRRRCTLGDGRGLLQCANGVADVLREVFDEADTTHIAALLAEPGDSPHLPKSQVACFSRSYSFSDVFLNQLIEMKAKLVFEVAFNAAAQDE